MPKLTDLTRQMTTTPAPDDLLHIVDVSDTTESPQGTSKKIERSLLASDGGYDATVGAVGSGADYNLVQDAIDAGKYNLLVIGDYTNSETVVLGANFVQITIAEKWTMNEGYVTIGAGGLKIQNGILEGVYTLLANKIFLGIGTLQMHNMSVFTVNSTTVNTGISQLTAGTKHIISNCNFALSDTGESGFLAPGNGSSFTNLNVIGGGVSCKEFIINAQDTLIDTIHFDGDTFENNGTMIKIGVGLDKGEAPKAFPDFSAINNVACEVGGSTMVISITDSFTQVSNITGSIALEYKASTCKTTNCSCIDLIFSGSTDSNYFANCSFAGATAISTDRDYNRFTNCDFNATFTLAAGSNNNELWQCSSVGGFTDSGANNSVNLTYINSAGMLTGGAITDAGGETIDVAAGTGYLRTTNSHTGILEQIAWPASAGIAIPTDTVRYVGVEYNSGTPQVLIKSTDLWDKHTEFRLGSVVNESTTLRLLDNPWMVANATGHAIERFFETFPFKRADRLGGLIIDETGTRQITVTAGEIYDLTNEFDITAIDTSVSGGFDSYAGLTQFASGTSQWDNQNYNNAGTITALGAAKWATLWWYLEADGKLVMNYGIVEHPNQAAADLEGEPPVRPVRVQVHGTLIGRTIFQKSAATGDFQSAFITQFAGAGSSDHTQLSNLTTGDAGHTQFLMRDGSKTMTGDLNMAGTGGLKVAAGTTGERPTPVNGHHRYNTTTNLHEFYQNGAWVNYASGPGPGILDKNSIIYVNGAGNDSNSGKNDEQPKLTISSALTAAAAQSPSSSNIVVVKVLGGVRYAENITVPSWVALDMRHAIILGQVTLGVTLSADTFYYANNIICPAASEAVRCTGAGHRYIHVISTAPSVNSTFISATNGATVHVDAGDLDAVAAGANTYELATGAVLYLRANKLRETAASTSAGATVFKNIVDDGANADTTSLNETGDQIIIGKDKVVFGTNIASSVLELDGSFQKWTTRPHFIAYNNASIDNVTGDGTVYTIVLGQVDANIGTHYNPATGIFTAPTTGLYNFNIVLVLTDVSSSFSDVNIRVLRTGTAATWYLHQSDPDKDYVGGYLILNGSIDMKLNSGDTAEFQVQVVGATKIIDVEQGTTFSGRLLTRI